MKKLLAGLFISLLAAAIPATALAALGAHPDDGMTVCATGKLNDYALKVHRFGSD